MPTKICAFEGYDTENPHQHFAGTTSYNPDLDAVARAKKAYDRREFWTWIGIGVFMAIPVVTLSLVYWFLIR